MTDKLISEHIPSPKPQKNDLYFYLQCFISVMSFVMVLSNWVHSLQDLTRSLRICAVVFLIFCNNFLILCLTHRLPTMMHHFQGGEDYVKIFPFDYQSASCYLILSTFSSIIYYHHRWRLNTTDRLELVTTTMIGLLLFDLVASTYQLKPRLLKYQYAKE